MRTIFVAAWHSMKGCSMFWLLNVWNRGRGLNDHPLLCHLSCMMWSSRQDRISHPISCVETLKQLPAAERGRLGRFFCLKAADVVNLHASFMMQMEFSMHERVIIFNLPHTFARNVRTEIPARRSLLFICVRSFSMQDDLHLLATVVEGIRR